MNYYVDTSGPQPRLGFIRVDAGGRGRWDRVLAKCRDDLQVHQRMLASAQFIDRQAFEITLITTLPKKLSDWPMPSPPGAIRAQV